jgi:biopolymer transport protein ExbD
MAKSARHLFHEDEARIEIIPMIDIMMFLLVFFIMFTLKMISNTGITQDLPGNAVTQDQHEVTKLIVGLAASGQLSVNNTPVTLAELDARLRAAKATEAQGNKVEVLIAAEKKADLQGVFTIMDSVRTAAIDAVSVATQTDSAPSAHGSIK